MTRNEFNNINITDQVWYGSEVFRVINVHDEEGLIKIDNIGGVASESDGTWVRYETCELAVPPAKQKELLNG